MRVTIEKVLVFSCIFVSFYSVSPLKLSYSIVDKLEAVFFVQRVVEEPNESDRSSPQVVAQGLQPCCEQS